MKKLFLSLILASGIMMASCQGDQNNQNVTEDEEESVGTSIDDEVGTTGGSINSDVQGEERIGGEAIGTEETVEDDNDDTELLTEPDTTESQQQYQ